MTRQEANKKILELISAQVEANPDLRFNQILHQLGLVQEINKPGYPDLLETLDFYEEPMVTLQRMTGN